MKKLIIAITLSAALLAGCGGSSSSAEPTQEATASSSKEGYGIDVDLIVTYNPSGREFRNLVAHIESTELSEDLLSAYYFKVLMPEHSAIEDDTIVDAYLIFDDMTGKFPEEYGDFLGCKLSANGSIETYVYLIQDEDGRIRTNSFLCTSDYQLFFVNSDEKNIELSYTAADFDEDEKEDIRDF